MESSRITLVNVPAFEVELEYNKDHAMLHLPRITKYNKTVFEQMVVYTRNLWLMLTTMGYEDLLVGVAVDDLKTSKLVLQLGFEPYNTNDGYTFYFYKDTFNA